jgi:hypothetical protein
MYTPPMGSGALTARNPERTDRARLSAVFAATQAGPARRTTLRHQGSPPTASSGWSTSPHSPRPHCLLLLRASVGPTPSEILCVDATHCMLDCGLRDLLLLAAAAAAAGDCPRGGRGCDRLGPRRRPCLTALLCCASLTMPRPPRHAAIPRLIGTTGARGEVESVWAEAAVLSDREALRLLGACSVRCGEFE